MNSGSSAGRSGHSLAGIYFLWAILLKQHAKQSIPVIGMTKRQPAMPIANIQLRTWAIILNNPRPRTHWGHSTS